MLILAKIWPVTAPSNWLLFHFDMFSSFLDTYFLAWQTIQMQPQAWNQTVLQRSWIPFRGKCNLVRKTWLCSWQLVYHCFQFPSLDRTRKYMQVYMLTHMHLYLFVFFSVYWKSWVHTETSNYSSAPQSSF